MTIFYSAADAHADTDATSFVGIALYLFHLSLFVVIFYLLIRNLSATNKDSDSDDDGTTLFSNDTCDPYIGYAVQRADDRKTPFGNAVRRLFRSHTQQSALAPSGAHVLITGVTGSGKSRRVLGPAALLWDGPAVVVSSKADMFDMCVRDRMISGGKGRTYLMDLSQSVPDDAVPAGCRRVVYDPVALARTDGHAQDIARELVESHRPGSQGSIDPFWREVPISVLAAVLRGAHLLDRDIWSCVDVISEMTERTGGEDEGNSYTSPDFSQWCPQTSAIINALIASGSRLHSSIVDLFGMSSKTASSIMPTLNNSMNPWKRGTLSKPCDADVFVPTMMQHPRATLFIVSPQSGSAAGPAASVVNVCVERWRTNQLEDVRLPRLALIIDEFCNTAPISNIETIVSEARSLGIVVVAAVQNIAQFERKYGSSVAQALERSFPCIVCLSPGEDQLWRHADSAVARLRAYGEQLPALPRPSRVIGEAAVFYNGQPRGAKHARDYICGTNVSLPDYSDIVSTLVPIPDHQVGNYHDQFVSRHVSDLTHHVDSSAFLSIEDSLCESDNDTMLYPYAEQSLVEQSLATVFSSQRWEKEVMGR